jgi:hypothetical protein
MSAKIAGKGLICAIGFSKTFDSNAGGSELLSTKNGNMSLQLKLRNQKLLTCQEN